MYTQRQISSLVVCLQRPDAAEADLRLLRKKCPNIDASAFSISPRRNQATILRHLLSVCTRDEIEKNRTGGVGVSPAQSPSAPVPALSGAGVQPKKNPAPQKTAKKKSSPKKKNTPTSPGTTSTTVTPSSPPSSTTTE